MIIELSGVQFGLKSYARDFKIKKKALSVAQRII